MHEYHKVEINSSDTEAIFLCLCTVVTNILFRRRTLPLRSIMCFIVPRYLLERQEGDLISRCLNVEIWDDITVLVLSFLQFPLFIMVYIDNYIHIQEDCPFLSIGTFIVTHGRE